MYSIFTLNPKFIEVLILFLLFSRASIIACRAIGCLIVALEADKKIFVGILQPMNDVVLPIAAAVVTEALPVVDSHDPDAMAVKVRKFVRPDRTSK